MYEKLRIVLISIILLAASNCNNVDNQKLVNKNKSTKTKITKREYLAIYRTDNDFTTSLDTINKKEKIPDIVQNEISVLEEKIKENCLTDDEFKDFVIYKVVYNLDISLYIVKAERFSFIRYYIFAYNTKTRIVTKNPQYINGKWMNNNEQSFTHENRLIESPLIFFDDINNDSIKEIAIKERAHNGNVYNAEIINYYSLSNDMELKKVLALESKFIIPLDKYIIKRELKDQSVISRINYNNNKEEIAGKVFLNFSDSLNIVKREVYDNHIEDLLITGSNINDIEFLRNGYIIEY